MAALDPASLQFARTLAFEEIPTKLRCATCNKLAIGAVKLPCCDQAICEECLQNPGENCPVCEHNPFIAGECKPHKSLRMTIKAFVKNEEKKREKEAALLAPTGNVVSTPSVVDDVKSIVENGTQAQPETSNVDITATTEAISDDVAPLIENVISETPHAEPFTNVNIDADETDAPKHDQSAVEGGDEEEEDDDEDNIVITTERSGQDDGFGQEQKSFGDGQEQDPQMSNNEQMPSFDENQQDLNNNFGGMNGFNPMMAMQNGMGMPGFPMGMPNMMGMPGMNMDPSMMFGMGGMNDMNMMSMGMGMGMGMNGFGGMPGMNMNGPGFFPGQGGYNNSNFGPNMHQNFRNDRGFGGRPYSRGYGRGRGYSAYARGRGGFHHQNQGYGSNQGYMNQTQNMHQAGVNDYDEGYQQSDQPRLRGSPSYEPMNTNGASSSDPSKFAEKEGDVENTSQAQAVDHSGNPGLLNGDVGNDTNAPADGEATNDHGSVEPLIGNDATNQLGASENGYAVHSDMQNDMGYSGTQGEQYPYENQYPQQHGYGRGRGGFRGGRGGFRGRGGFANHSYGYQSEATEVTSTPAPPVNAPTGPKAMREGKPNSGWFSRPQSSTSTIPSTVVIPTGPAAKSDGVGGHDNTRENGARPRSRSRSQSRHSSRKQRAKSPEENYESDETYRRRKDRERRKRKERERARDDSSTRRERSGEDDADSSRRHRDKDTDVRSSRTHRERSHERRRRRHRSRSPDKDGDAPTPVDSDIGSTKRRSRRHDDEYDQERSRKASHRDDENDKLDNKDRSSRHSRSARDTTRDRPRERHQHEEVASVIEQPPDDFKIKGSRSAAMPPPTEPSSRRQRDRDRDQDRDRTRDRDRDRDRSSRDTNNHRREQSPAPTTIKASAKTSADPYAEERERRHAERVLKEQQRRQSSNPSSLGKRSSRDDGTADDLDGLSVPRGPRGDGRRNRKERRMNVRYEGEVDDDSGERDAGRW